ncbi:hypothetical protein [Maritimibacter sp. DP1N21-5]|uniref:hypothetical protein n=1 Tax=Maritimibacter sp. DP1N21-5 TaxID=2836867 RepID=UPI001C47EB2A|nr:hypothetical protein [Maritimibacter sp. DP1N21-5]MBV7410705.1 hypothetical protein [Maritimibacter sp. DP1N21-5]
MDIKVLGIDFGKTFCSLAGLDGAGAIVFRKRLQRHRLQDFLTLPPRVVAKEACGGARRGFGNRPRITVVVLVNLHMS